MSNWDSKATEDILSDFAIDYVIDRLPRMHISVLFKEVILTSIAYVLYGVDVVFVFVSGHDIRGCMMREPGISSSEPFRNRDPAFLDKVTDFLIRLRLLSKSRAN